MTWHNALRDWIVSEWGGTGVPVVSCQVCGHVLHAPPGTSAIAEYTIGSMRADVGILDAGGAIVGVVEIIDTSPPSTAKLSAQEQLPAVWYVERTAAYCSPDCYTFAKTHPGDERASDWEPLRCIDCGKLTHDNPTCTTAFAYYEDGDILCYDCALNVPVTVDRDTQLVVIQGAREYIGRFPSMDLPEIEDAAARELIEDRYRRWRAAGLDQERREIERRDWITACTIIGAHRSPYGITPCEVCGETGF